MKKIFYLFLFSIAIIFSTNCKRETNNKIINEPHVNAFPKKVTVYQIDTITNTDSLLYTIIFYKNDSKNYIDSFNVTNLPFAPEFTRTYNITSSTYGIYIDTYAFPEVGVYYDANGNLINLQIGVNNCDGINPGDDYNFKYNTDGSLEFYDRQIYSARCGDYYDTSHFVYLNDTVLFNNSDIRYCSAIDTIIYLKDNLHVSTIPLFYYGRNSFFQGCGGNFFNINSYIFEFFKFGSKNMPLINEIKIGGDRLFYVVKYSYLFNGNNDVSQMIMNLYSRLPEYNKRIKYRFEY